LREVFTKAPAKGEQATR